MHIKSLTPTLQLVHSLRLNLALNGDKSRTLRFVLCSNFLPPFCRNRHIGFKKIFFFFNGNIFCYIFQPPENSDKYLCTSLTYFKFPTKNNWKCMKINPPPLPILHIQCLNYVRPVLVRLDVASIEHCKTQIIS